MRKQHSDDAVERERSGRRGEHTKTSPVEINYLQVLAAGPNVDEPFVGDSRAEAELQFNQVRTSGETLQSCDTHKGLNKI